MNYIPINRWAADDRPREKLLMHGAVTLSDAELIAILIGSGYKEMSAVDVAKKILHTQDYNLNRLARLSVEELQKFKGIGQAKAVSIVAAMELSRRRRISTKEDKVLITSSRYAFEIFSAVLSDMNHEEFWVLYLNNALRVISKIKIGKGGFTSSAVDLRIVIKKALELSSTAIVLAHNHPSGSVRPSEQDKKLTTRIVEAGKIMDIRVLDHLIIGENTYFSFSDEGLL